MGPEWCGALGVMMDVDVLGGWVQRHVTGGTLADDDAWPWGGSMY